VVKSRVCDSVVLYCSWERGIMADDEGAEEGLYSSLLNGSMVAWFHGSIRIMVQ